MKLNERYELIGKEIDEIFNKKPKTNSSYEFVVKEVDEYFKAHNI